MRPRSDSLEQIKQKLKGFPNNDESNLLAKASEVYKEFLVQYPYRERPDLIDSLTHDGVYNKDGDYFFNWIEHKLKPIGHLSIGSAAYLQSARENIDKLKTLLKIAVDDSRPISDK